MPSTLALAIENQQWERAALWLLLGVAEAAAQLPPETISSLLELLDQPQRPRSPSSRGKRGRRR